LSDIHENDHIESENEDCNPEAVACVDAESPKAEPAKPRQSTLSSVLDYVEIFAIAIAVVLLLFSFFVRLCTVSGPSMNQTLNHGDRLLVSDFMYEPKRNDIVVFHQTGQLNEPVVKRVIATEGETVDIDFYTWTVTVTDTEGKTFVLDESEYLYLAHDAIVTSSLQYPYTVPEGCLFVMGDNRNHSADSRNDLIGPVDERRVMGKVILRLSPDFQVMN